MFPPALLKQATALVESCSAKGLRVTTAESCTGGLVAALITEIAGSSAMFERGFVTYSNDAKADLLGVPAELLTRYGAVSAPCAIAMAEGALAHGRADVAVSVTGIAGPGGGSPEKPVGLVHFAVLRRGGLVTPVERRFGAIGRSAVRWASVDQALALLEAACQG